MINNTNKFSINVYLREIELLMENKSDIPNFYLISELINFLKGSNFCFARIYTCVLPTRNLDIIYKRALLMPKSVIFRSYIHCYHNGNISNVTFISNILKSLNYNINLYKKFIKSEHFKNMDQAYINKQIFYDEFIHLVEFYHRI
jgi:hypothetical protein